MSRTHQELQALASLIKGFKETECPDQKCEDCPIGSTICMAIVKPDDLIEVTIVEYLKEHGITQVIVDWLQARMRW